MHAGRLNRRITLQRKTGATDSYGAEIATWTDVATVWAAIEPLSGREFFASRQINAELTTRIVIRYLAGVVPAMRIVHGAKLYDILSVIDPRDAHVELQLMCTEKVR